MTAPWLPWAPAGAVRGGPRPEPGRRQRSMTLTRPIPPMRRAALRILLLAAPAMVMAACGRKGDLEPPPKREGGAKESGG